MSRFSETFFSALRIFKRHSVLSLILVAQCILCFSLIGNVTEQFLQTKISVDNFHKNITDKSYYQLHECFDEIQFYRLSKENYKYKELAVFMRKARESKRFRLISAIEQPVVLTEYEIPEICLDCYEFGDPENSVWYSEKGEKLFCALSMQVGESFFNEFGITASEGKLWDKSAYIYEKGKTVPIVLGNAYIGTAKIGDRFELEYLYEKMHAEVVGFLPSNCQAVRDFSIINCDRYMFLPSFWVDENNPNEFNKLRLIQQALAMIVSDESFEETKATVEALLKECDVPIGTNNGMMLTDPSDMTAGLQDYASMTQEVKNQFLILLLVLIVFVIFTLSLTINGFVRDNHYEYGVQLLLGAKWSEIKLSVLYLTGTIVGLGFICETYFIIYLGKHLLTAVVLFLVAVFMTILSSLLPIHYLKKMDVSEIIGGKE